MPTLAYAPKSMAAGDSGYRSELITRDRTIRIDEATNRVETSPGLYLDGPDKGYFPRPGTRARLHRHPDPIRQRRAVPSRIMARPARDRITIAMVIGPVPVVLTRSMSLKGLFGSRQWLLVYCGEDTEFSKAAELSPLPVPPTLPASLDHLLAQQHRSHGAPSGSCHTRIRPGPRPAQSSAQFRRAAPRSWHLLE